MNIDAPKDNHSTAPSYLFRLYLTRGGTYRLLAGSEHSQTSVLPVAALREEVWDEDTQPTVIRQPEHVYCSW